MMNGSGKEESSSPDGASTAVKDKEPNSTHNKNNNLNSDDDDVIRSNTTIQEIHTSNIQNNASTEVQQQSPEESKLFKQALDSLSQQAATSSPQRQIDASVHPISTATTNTTASSITNRRSMNDSPPNIQNLEESYFNKSPTSNNNNTASNIKPDISTSNNIETNNNGNHTTTTTSPPPSEENITQLTNMGFNREEVIDALQHTNNNINAAADRLLNIETMTPPRKQEAEPIEKSSTGSIRRGGDKDKKNSGKKKATFSEDTDMSKTRETRTPIPRKRDATVSQSRKKKKNSTSTNPEVIDLLDDSSDSDSDDNMEDRKMPAKKKNVGKRSIEMEEESDSDSDWEEDSKMPAAKTKVKSESSSSPVARAKSTDFGKSQEDSTKLKSASSSPVARKRKAEDTNISARDKSTKLNSASFSATDEAAFEAQLAKALKDSEEEERKSKERTKEIEEGTYIPPCHILSRQEFKKVVDEVVEDLGGYEKIEGGSLIKSGNGAAEFVKGAVTGGSGLKNQTRAQYGRYSIERLWRVFDVLEGKEDIEIKEEDDDGDKVASSLEKKKRKLDVPKRLEGLEGAEIKAFLDIGHGIGIQVIQAGWSQSVPSRGVEIVKDRHLISELIREGVVERLRSDPPDSTKAELRLNDFVPAITEGDKKLLDFLLFKNKPLDTQEGLVIFVNNAEDVFGARSNDNGQGVALDYRLAQLFAQMQVGGRIVTLTDISSHCQNSNWFTRTVWKSGTGAVSWGGQNKSLDVFVLTKTKETWTCQNTKCPYLGLGEGGYSIPLLGDNGDFLDKCTFCGIGAKRCGRVRKPTRKAS